MSNLGEKRQCPKCNAKFYDFGADPVKCPKCSHSWSAKSAKPGRKSKKTADAPKPKKLIKPKLDEDELPSDLPADDGDVEELEQLEDDVEVQSLEEIGEHEEADDSDPNGDDADDEMFLEDKLPEDAIVDDLEDYIERDEDEDEDEEEDDEDDEDEDEDESPRSGRKKKRT